MRVFVIFSFFSFFISNNTAFAQKHDRIWVFGQNAGIDFNNPNNPQAFYIYNNNGELSGSFSYPNGDLMFYTSFKLGSGGSFQLLDSLSQIIKGSESINSNISCTNCFMVIPSPEQSNSLYAFHIGTHNIPNCTFFYCYRFYYTIIKYNNDSVWVEEKNIPLLNEWIGERIAATKHANGKDWWILVRGTPVLPGGPCTNRYYKYLLSKNGIEGPSMQDIGSISCKNNFFAWGEMNFSKDGKRLAIALDEDGNIDLYDFNRCTGELSNFRLIDNLGTEYPYSCEFSPSGDFLYISISASSGIGTIYQYNLKSLNISGSKVKIWSDTTSFARTGQLQIAPDNRIYFPIWFTSNLYQHKEHYLSVINEPDSVDLACDFQPFSFYLGDSSRVHYGLPNMPNYTLGSLSIYESDAGENITYCIEDSIRGGYIGSPEVPGVEYAWFPEEGLDNPHFAMPYANPNQTTMYTLTLTDTTIRNACQSRTDTVWVNVETCTIPEDKGNEFFPTAFAPGSSGVNAVFGNIKPGTTLLELKIFNRWGQLIHNSPTNWDGTFNNTPQPMGTYIYQAIIQRANGDKEKVIGEVVLVR